MQHCAPLVLHLDVDAFFVQVEQLRDPCLKGKAVAIQQHQDIIAANHAAKAAGVVKHCSPAEARKALQKVGGRVVHVHTATGNRVSYTPYRHASRDLMRLLSSLPWAAVVEKASIDEAYILVQPAAWEAAAAAAAGSIAPSPGPAASLGPAAAELGRRCAQEAKAAALAQLGLVVSVGVAPNKLLAKLASAASKPDGVLVVAGQEEAHALLARTPARRLPGCGGRLADMFEQNGIRNATDLLAHTPRQLQQLLGVKEQQAEQLHSWCRGQDASQVQVKGPAKSISVQMSLTPQLLKAHPSHAHEVSACGGPTGVLKPLVTGEPDFPARVRMLMTAMGGDLLERVREDREEEQRWPRALAVALRCFGAGRDQQFTNRSGAFPHWSLQQQQTHQQQAAQQQPRQQQQTQPHQQNDQAAQRAGQQPDALLSRLVSSLEALVRQVAASYPPTATVVEVRLVATNFAGLQMLAAPISRFFQPRAVGGTEQPKQEHRQHQEAPQLPTASKRPEQGGLSAGCQQPEPAAHQPANDGAGQLPEQSADAAAAVAKPAAQQAFPRTSAGAAAAEPLAAAAVEPAPQQPVDLGAVDLAEQRRILQQIEAARAAEQGSNAGGSAAAAAATGKAQGAAGKKRKGSASEEAQQDASQPKIAAFFRPLRQ